MHARQGQEGALLHEEGTLAGCLAGRAAGCCLRFQGLQTAGMLASPSKRAKPGSRQLAACVRVGQSEPPHNHAQQLQTACRLAPPRQVKFVSEADGVALSGQKGQIELVVGEGVEAFLPMAGESGGPRMCVSSPRVLVVGWCSALLSLLGRPGGHALATSSGCACFLERYVTAAAQQRGTLPPCFRAVMCQSFLFGSPLPRPLSPGPPVFANYQLLTPPRG